MKRMFKVKYLLSLRKIAMAGSKPILTLEGKGFGVKAYPSGKMSFYYAYQIDGKKSYLTLGDWKDPEAARMEWKCRES
jgi:hypothetical protein